MSSFLHSGKKTGKMIWLCLPAHDSSLLNRRHSLLDRYLGNSWASGIALYGGRPYLNGRNQESSSEAIAAYEGIAMYGSTMMKAFGNGKSTNQAWNENAYTACQIFNLGRFLATTEYVQVAICMLSLTCASLISISIKRVRSADRYWHVYSPKRDIVYPDSYTPAVVSMMWDTMCQFQTWFGYVS